MRENRDEVTFVFNEREILDVNQDALGWRDHAKRLAMLLALPGRPTPLTLGIQGDWGSGKSSFLNLVVAQLGSLQPSLPPVDDCPLASHLIEYHYSPGKAHQIYSNHPDVKVYLLHFDSWIFTQSDLPVDYLFPIFIFQVLRDYLVSIGKVSASALQWEAISSLERILPKLGGGIVSGAGSVLGGLVAGPAGIALGGMAGLLTAGMNEWISGQKVNSKLYRELLTRLVQFKSDFQWMVDVLLAPSAEQAEHLQQLGDTHYNRLFILVDDLDRIPALSAVNVTEKIKLLMDVPGCIFVLAADLQVIREGLKIKLGERVTEEEGKNYLDKIIRLQYHVPPVSSEKAREFAHYYTRWIHTFQKVQNTLIPHDNAQNYHDLAEEILCWFPVISSNPRNLKRVLNNFSFALDLQYDLEASADPDTALRVLALTILNQYDPETARIIYQWLSNKQSPGDRTFKTLKIGVHHSKQKQLDPRISSFIDYMVRLNYTDDDWKAAFTLTAISQSTPSSPAMPRQ